MLTDSESNNKPDPTYVFTKQEVDESVKYATDEPDSADDVSADHIALFGSQAFKDALIDQLKKIPSDWSLVPIQTGLQLKDGEMVGLKSPRNLKWQTTNFSRDFIAAGIQSGEYYGYGLKLDTGILAIDIDGSDAQLVYDSIFGTEEQPKTVKFTSGKPGRSQVLYKVPESMREGLARKAIKYNGQELDFRWGYFQSCLPLTVHSPKYGTYEWLPGCSPEETEIAVIPDCLLAYWIDTLKPSETAIVEVVKELPDQLNKDADAPSVVHWETSIPIQTLMAKESRGLLAGVPKNSRNNAAIKVAFELIGVQLLTEVSCFIKEITYKVKVAQDALSIFYSFGAACNPPMDLAELDKVWQSAIKRNPAPAVRTGYRDNMLKCWLKPQLKAAQGAMVVPDKPNILTLQASISNLNESVRFNTMTGKVEVDGESLNLDLLRLFTINKFGYTLGIDDCIACWKSAALKDKYHPVVEYLQNLPSSTPKVDLLSLCKDLLGNDSPLAAVMLKKKLIACVARVMQPGCKADEIFVLIGEQGLCKTSFIEALASTPWFTNSLKDISNKDHLRLLGSKWLIEMGELDGVLSKKDDAELKNFMTHTEDTYRTPYSRENEDVKRASSMLASTNKEQFLLDPTGTRRFMNVKVLKRIDIPLVKKMRDPIWYSAYLAYQAGEIWHLTHEEEAQQKIENRQYEVTDPWESCLKLWGNLEKNGDNYVISYDALYLMLEIGKAARNNQTNTRIANIMTKWGFKYKLVNNKQHKAHLWVRPIPKS